MIIDFVFTKKNVYTKKTLIKKKNGSGQIMPALAVGVTSVLLDEM